MANSITITDGGAQSIRSDEQCYAEYDAAIKCILQTGKKYVLFGVRDVEHADLSYLESQRSFYERRILIRKGAMARTYGDFS